LLITLLSYVKMSSIVKARECVIEEARIGEADALFAEES
jgi:hypothetical protein